MNGAIKSTRSLKSLFFLTLVGLFGWISSPAHVWIWLEPTAHAASMTFVVNSEADPGDGTCNASNCTLREAISAANNNPGTDTINFNIAGTGVRTINLTAVLPSITDPVQILGVTQPGYTGTPLIELNGAGAGSDAQGLQINSGGSIVVALTINRFSGDGVRISGPGGGNAILDCYIGTNNAGSAAQGNGLAGVRISSSPNNTVGGGFCASPLGCLESQLRFGVISGNSAGGVVIEGAGATNNVLKRAYIGTNATATAAVGNAGTAGVRVTDSSNNTIGGTTAAARNVISGNDGGAFTIGVYIDGTSSGNKVQGNYIGTDVSGTSALRNTGGGVFVLASNNTVGGTAASERNVISGNDYAGVLVGGLVTGVAVQGNFIGTNKDGTAALGNIRTGVLVRAPIIIGGTVGATPGGPCTGACNVISGNGNGIEIDFADGAQVQGNYIGTDVTGTVDVGNTNSGVLVDTVANTIIGGATPAARNIISGNNQDGVKLTGDGSGSGGRENKVQGNFIGTTANGLQALANSRSGVFITGTEQQSVVGGATSGTGNLISGNPVGVTIDGSDTSQTNGNGPILNLIQGNFIGTNLTGSAALPNTNFGVLIVEAGFNTIGGTESATRNVISGNRTGVAIQGLNAIGNRVQGNYIGTKPNGTEALANTLDGMVLDGIQNMVGGTSTGARNIISGNNRNGIFITGTQNQIQGNYIGTDAGGTQVLSNSGDGVIILASNNTIGGSMAGARNVISGNTSDGVEINGGGVTGNRVEGNFIGPDVNGSGDLGNTGNGVNISLNATGNIIGGTVSGAGNTISGNNASGVFLTGSGTTQNLVQGNRIGTKANGIEPLGNNFFGVRLTDGAFNNTIGGAVAGARNLISSNGNGVRISDQTTVGNKIHGNYIGTDATGTADLGNTNEGVFLDNAPNNFIGGPAAGEGNVISGNDGSGVRILDDKATGNRVEGNLIGTKVNGTEALGNSSHGVYIRNVSSNTVGGIAAGASNTIAFNGGDGVFIEPGNAATSANAVLSNAIFSNTGLGIDLFPDGVTANDAGDTDTGANNLQNFPTLSSAIAFPSGTTVAGTFNSTANVAFRLEFFSNTSCDPSGNGEGQTFIGSISVTTNPGGNADFNTSALSSVPAGRFITATATDPAGNTSEFSQCLAARAANADLSISMADSPDPVAAGSTLTYTITLTNSGPERAEAVVVTDNLPAQMNFISCSSTGGGVCSGTGNNRTITFTALGMSETVSITLVAAVSVSTSAGTISNTATVNSAATDPNASNNSVTIATTVFATPLFQFSAASYSVVEDCTSVSITVIRSGPVTDAATVNYATGDATASERSDYTTALGTLRFAAGETTKSFDLLINEDSRVEGTETAMVVLSNPTGASLGNPSTATVEIVDDASEPAGNPIDDAQNFACQNYHDFLNRQPDAAGLDFWTNQITQCGADAQCIELKRINVSAAFFLSIEFQETGYLVYRFHQSAFGAGPTLGMRSFLADTQEIGRGVVVGAPGWEQQLEANKQAYANELVTRSQFTAQYPGGMTAAQFVDGLNANTLDPLNPGAGGSLSMAERDQLVSDLSAGNLTRAQVLRAVAEDADLRAREFNRAFVYMQYIGYLRRNANDPPDNNFDGYNFWLGKLNQFNGNFIQAEMVKAFIVSSEYRGRFGN